MMQRQLAQHSFAARCRVNQHLTVVVRAAASPCQASLLQPVKKLYGAVMLNLEPLGQVADRGRCSAGQPLDGQQQLVLLRLESRRAGRLLAEMQEPPDLMTELSQSAVLGNGDVDGSLSHLIYIVTRYYYWCSKLW